MMELYDMIKSKLTIFNLSNAFYQEQKVIELTQEAEDCLYLELDYNNLQTE